MASFLTYAITFVLVLSLLVFVVLFGPNPRFRSVAPRLRWLTEEKHADRNRKQVFDEGCPVCS